MRQPWISYEFSHLTRLHKYHYISICLLVHHLLTKLYRKVPNKTGDMHNRKTSFSLSSMMIFWTCNWDYNASNSFRWETTLLRHKHITKMLLSSFAAPSSRLQITRAFNTGQLHHLLIPDVFLTHARAGAIVSFHKLITKMLLSSFATPSLRHHATRAFNTDQLHHLLMLDIPLTLAWAGAIILCHKLITKLSLLSFAPS